MYCTNCGQKVENGWKYCPNCNSPIKAPNIENNPLPGVNYQPNNNENSTPNVEKAKKLNKYIVGVFICEALAYTPGGRLSFLIFISIGIAIAGMIKYPEDKNMKLLFVFTLVPFILIILGLIILLVFCHNLGF